MAAEWIKISRKITEMRDYFGEPFNRAMCWIDLLLLAEWKDERVFYIRGNKITVKRGQVAISVKELSQRWKLSYPTVANRLKEMEIDGKITIERSKLINLITIANYSLYQDLNFISDDDKGFSQTLLSENDMKATENEEVTEPVLQQTLHQTLQQTLHQTLQQLGKNVAQGVQPSEKNISANSQQSENEEVTAVLNLPNITNIYTSTSISSIYNNNKEKENTTSKDVVKEKERASNFRKPTIAEVKAYVEEKGYAVDAERFFYFYESKGWYVGKNKMKNWHAAVATWQRKEKENGNYNRSAAKQQRDEAFARHIIAKINGGDNEPDFAGADTAVR